MPESKEPSNSIKAAKTYFSIINTDIPNWDLEINDENYEYYDKRLFPSIYGNKPSGYNDAGNLDKGIDEDPNKLIKMPLVASLVEDETKTKIDILVSPNGFPEKSTIYGAEPIIHAGILLAVMVTTSKKMKGLPSPMLLAHYGLRVDDPMLSSDELLLKLVNIIYENAKNIDVKLKGPKKT